MRDPERITRIIGKLEKFWRLNPDLRLGQIVVFFLGEKDPFYVEDDVFEKNFDMTVNLLKKKTE